MGDVDCVVGRCLAEPNKLKLCSDVGLFTHFPDEDGGTFNAGTLFNIKWSVSNSSVVQALNGEGWKVDLSLVNKDLVEVVEIASELDWDVEKDFEYFEWTSHSYLPTGLYRIKTSWSGSGNEAGFVTGNLFQVFGTSVQVSEHKSVKRLINLQPTPNSKNPNSSLQMQIFSPKRQDRFIAGHYLTSTFLVTGSIPFVKILLAKADSQTPTAGVDTLFLGDFGTTVGSLTSASFSLPQSLSSDDYVLFVRSA